MKKALFFVGFLGLVFSAFGQSASDFVYRQENGGITITGYKGSAKNVVIPEKINGLPVTTIGYAAFHDNQLTSVTIPNPVTTIRVAAFAENQITSVTIPNSGTTIGVAAFALNSVKDASEPFSVMVYKNTVTIIGYNRIEKNVVIPENINGLPVTAIGACTFTDNQLTSVTIPNSVTTIGDDAFDDDVTIRRQ